MSCWCVVVLAQGLGHEDRQAPGDEEGDRGEKHKPVSDIDAAVVVDSLKVLDPKRPIREADVIAAATNVCSLGVNDTVGWPKL
jgi:hypothetical protein